jgi:oligoendopeptidase F
MLRRPHATTLGLAAALAFSASPAGASEREAIPEKLRWNLTEIYPDARAWDAAYQRARESLPELAGLRGKLGASPAALYEGLARSSDLSRDLERLSVYANMLHDLDQRASQGQQMKQAASQLRTEAAAATSWIRPEILGLGAERIGAALAAEPRLAPWRQPLADVVRRAPHTLPAEQERIVALAGNIAGAGNDIRSIFVNAELPYPEITLSTGERVRLDAAAYSKHRASPVREDRLAAFRAFWSTYARYTRTLATALNAQVQAHVFHQQARGFGSCLEAALFADNVPVAVYRRLLDDVHANLQTLHRYLRLRQRMMGLERLGYEDLYAPIVPSYTRTFTPDEAMDLTLAAVAPLGPEYQAALRRSFDERWIDWLPSTGKRSGAYSTGVYGVHPYQLQNFTGLFDEVSTLAHESGHSMHTYFSDRAQPYPTHDYPIFVAEVASTLNENLLAHAMLERARGDDERLFQLGSQLDNLRTTLFRQTLFAEFELRIHERGERGEPLTAESLNTLYLELLRRYYGHDAGICAIDEAYAVEWAFIPHFYYDFYVYQYATSITASSSIADGIRGEAAAARPATARRDGYLGLLSAGSSRYAFDLLRDAGVDLTTSEPFDAAMREMNRIMDRMEAILDGRTAR